MNSVNETPAGIVSGLYKVLRRGDVAALLAGLAPDIVWVVAPGLHYGGTYHGREAVLSNVFARFTTDWEGFTVEPTEIIAAGDTVVAPGHYRGRSIATGTDMVTRFVHLWRLRDNVPVHFETVLDTYTMRTAAHA